jgi:plastocyanin
MLYGMISVLLVFIIMPFSYAFGENSTIPWKVEIKTNHEVNGTSFLPPEIHARQNETIQWKNNDTTAHTVTSGVLDHPTYVGKIFDSDIIKPGENYSLTISDHMWSGYYYFCKIHPWMTGKIDVGIAYLGTSPDFNIETDKEQYSEGELIRISGIVNNTNQITPITIQIFDNQRNLVYLDKTNLLSDRSFLYEINATSSIFKTKGDYKIKSFFGFPSTITDLDIIFNGIQPNTTSNLHYIPHWLKNNAIWWSNGKISDSDFVNEVQFLMKNKYLLITKPQMQGVNSNIIPIWIKDDAKNWANNKIVDDKFATSLQYLIIHGIIKI